MNNTFYIPESKLDEQEILDWCLETLPSINGDRRYNYFPYVTYGTDFLKVVKFIIYNDDDAIAFKLKWNPLE